MSSAFIDPWIGLLTWYLLNVTLKNTSFALRTKNEVERKPPLVRFFSSGLLNYLRPTASPQPTLNLLCSSIALRKEVHKDFIEKFLFYKVYFLDIYSHLPLTGSKSVASEKARRYDLHLLLLFVCFSFFLLNSWATLGKFLNFFWASFISVWTLKAAKAKTGKRCWM